MKESSTVYLQANDITTAIICVITIDILKTLHSSPIRNIVRVLINLPAREDLGRIPATQIVSLVGSGFAPCRQKGLQSIHWPKSHHTHKLNITCHMGCYSTSTPVINLACIRPGPLRISSLTLFSL